MAGHTNCCRPWLLLVPGFQTPATMKGPLPLASHSVSLNWQCGVFQNSMRSIVKQVIMVSTIEKQLRTCVSTYCILHRKWIRNIVLYAHHHYSFLKAAKAGKSRQAMPLIGYHLSKEANCLSPSPEAQLCRPDFEQVVLNEFSAKKISFSTD